MALLELTRFRTYPRTGGILSLARRAAAVRRQRLALRRLDDMALRDLGLTRQMADREAAKPFWDVPETWRTR